MNRDANERQYLKRGGDRNLLDVVVEERARERINEESAERNGAEAALSVKNDNDGLMPTSAG